jgi:catechol 2,3-dioxygenase-like lactoylglutathione lyase family enzyme
MIQPDGFHHVAITVSDCDASAAWYADVLGFQEVFREEAEGRRACVMRFPGGAMSVGLVEHRPVDTADIFDPRRRGLDHLAFSVGSRDALESFAAQLTAGGIPNSGAIEVAPGAILNFKDPDGIALALFWDRA